VFEEQQLRDDQVGDLIIDRRTKQNHAPLSATVSRLSYAPLAAIGALDHPSG
jgi:hypothetical protein